ncbi:F0F1 ATP synthase subunit A [Marinoscillum sp.]|uniref:F0F1 ATP synthase subunit A n=1 Tax=Marinoscillum sp. TaxID=2024838 RepID=UPI003BA879CF
MGVSLRKIIGLAGLVTLLTFAGLNKSLAAGGEGESFSPGEMITHHITDDYVWHFFDGHYGTLYLPVILYTDNGVEVFSSSNFYNDDHEQVAYGNYEIDHGHIKTLDGTSVIDVSITKNVASMFVSIILMLLVFLSIAKSYKRNPGEAPRGLQSFFEPIILFIKDEIAIPNIGEKKYKKFLPFLLTLFFFIWFNNLLGLMPGGANLTGNISVTFVLAFIVLIITLASSGKAYWQHIFAMPGVPKPILLILIPIELIGILTKPFSLMVRLFANITAGHIIILSLLSLIFIFESVWIAPASVAFSIFMNFLELFVALLQAYIFTLLSAMYFGAAVEEAHH